MKPAGAVRLHVEPIRRSLINRYIVAMHRHHGAFPCRYAIATIAACEDDGTIHGVAILAGANAGNRLTDGFRTAEVVRVATDGTPNACSVLYAACAGAAKRLGYSRIITYVLPSETGTSLKASGWVCDGDNFGNLTWANRPKRTGSNYGAKTRWSLEFSPLDRPTAHLPDSIVLPTEPELDLFCDEDQRQ